MSVAVRSVDDDKEMEEEEVKGNGRLDRSEREDGGKDGQAAEARNCCC